MTKNSANSQPNFTIRQLMEAGVHFGHKTMRRNPKMSRYIHTERDNISIIDLNKTAVLLNEALKIAYQTAKNNGKILFVATKKQAAEAVAEAANRCGQYYVNSRWLGGMLTNWKTVSQSLKALKKIEEQLLDKDIGFLKKEKLMLERQRQKLETNLGGIKNMGGYPDFVFIIDINKEALALAEAKKLGIPVMAIVDTNCNPDDVNYIIPGNDDSAKSIKLYCRLISEAVIEGIRDNIAASGVDISKMQNDEIASKAQEIKAAEELAKKSEKKTNFGKDNKSKNPGKKRPDNVEKSDKAKDLKGKQSAKPTKNKNAENSVDVKEKPSKNNAESAAENHSAETKNQA